MRKTVFIFTALIGLFVSMTACANKKGNDMSTNTTGTAPKNGKTLVAYASYTGTTEGVAKMIATATGGELYKIEPEKEYTAADLDWTDKASRCCKENNDPKARPAMKNAKPNLDQYDTIYLGYPNWWNSHPRLINTFIEAYQLKGKTVIPFMTSGGSQIENSERILKKDYPEINWKKGKLLNGASQSEVNAWVKTLQ